jgi:hypothetical protein
MIEKRIQLLKTMNDYVVNYINDEELIYDHWFSMGIPDCPCEEDFQSIAKDTQDFNSICRVFSTIVTNDD